MTRRSCQGDSPPDRKNCRNEPSPACCEPDRTADLPVSPQRNHKTPTKRASLLLADLLSCCMKAEIDRRLVSQPAGSAILGDCTFSRLGFLTASTLTSAEGRTKLAEEHSCPIRLNRDRAHLFQSNRIPSSCFTSTPSDVVDVNNDNAASKASTHWYICSCWSARRIRQCLMMSTSFHTLSGTIPF